MLPKIIALCFLSTITFAIRDELKSIPDYIHICKRDQDTVDECVKNSIEFLRPYLKVGIPELKVPAIEPLILPEIITDLGNVIRFKTIGRNISVTGLSDFKIESLTVDLDDLIISGMVHFPLLQFKGSYDVDALLFVVPVRGKGTIHSNATKCLAEATIKCKIEEKNGKEYLKLTSILMDVNLQDYSAKLTDFFGVDSELSNYANRIIDQNKVDLYRASKPHLERACANILKKIGNRIANTFPLDDLMPIP